DFTLSAEDEAHPVVSRRLRATKRLQVIDVEDKKDLPQRAAKAAAALEGKVIVFLSSVEHAEKAADALRKKKKQVQVLTGTMRGAERDELVTTPVFARFLPRTPVGVIPAEGTVYLVATSAGEVGIDISGDHVVTDLPPFDALAQRLGRVNRYGDGDALIQVLCEPIARPARATEKGETDGEEGRPGKRKEELDRARYAARELLGTLPQLPDGSRDASPAALRSLAVDARLAACTPAPGVRVADDLLFDR